MVIVAVQINGRAEYTYGYGKDGTLWRWTRYLSEEKGKFYWASPEWVPSVGF